MEKNCSRCLVAADDIEPKEAICVEALKQIGLRRNALSAPGTHDCRADRRGLCSAHRGCIETLIHGAPYHSNVNSANTLPEMLEGIGRYTHVPTPSCPGQDKPSDAGTSVVATRTYWSPLFTKSEASPPSIFTTGSTVSAETLVLPK